MSKTYQIREAGSVAFVMDGGRPFILEKKETRLSPTVGNGVEVEYNALGAIVPLGADLDKSFVKNIGNAKSIKEVYDICESWVNV